MVNENTIKINKIPKKILIIKPSSLGDVIHSLPFLNVIKSHFESSKIHWVIAKGLECLFEYHPMIDKLWVINKDEWKNIRKLRDTISEISNLYKELKDESYDIVIDLQGLLRSGILANATNAPIRIGFKEAREGSTMFYTHKIEGGKKIHAVDRYLRIASALGCNIDNIIFPLPLIFESENISDLKNNMKEYAVIVPGARWKTKQWPPENFAKLSSIMNIKCIVVGSKEDKEISDYIESYSSGNAISMAGKTNLKELISLIRNARFIVSNDSGPMHIAAACNIPVIAIFGPTNPVKTGPYGQMNTVVKSTLPCSPCYKRKCKTIECMKDISVDDVYKAVRKINSEIIP